MGTQVVALMYGLQRSKNASLFDEHGEPFWTSIKTPVKKRLKWDSELVPRVAYEGDVFGFAVAAGPSCNDNEGFLGTTFRVEDLEETFKSEIQRAKEQWAKFAVWLSEVHGKELAKPRLYITTDER